MPIAPHPTTGRGTIGKGTKKLGSGGSGGRVKHSPHVIALFGQSNCCL